MHPHQSYRLARDRQFRLQQEARKGAKERHNRGAGSAEKSQWTPHGLRTPRLAAPELGNKEPEKPRDFSRARSYAFDCAAGELADEAS